MSPRTFGEVVFRATSPKDDLFDLVIDSRAGENDLRREQFTGALLRRRVPADAKVWVETWDRHREPLAARW